MATVRFTWRLTPEEVKASKWLEDEVSYLAKKMLFSLEKETEMKRGEYHVQIMVELFPQ